MKKRPQEFPEKITQWIGSPQSLAIHTIFFVGIFALHFFDYSSSDILLILTTIVSLEASCMAIFIQITINRHSEDLEEVSEDIEDLQEDVEEISEDDIAETKEEKKEDQEEKEKFKQIEDTLQTLLREISELKRK